MDTLFRSKEVSWLSFNGRVLQEACDPEVPLMERIKFLGIYSSNLDEFFRVRVATLKRLASLGKYYQKLDIPAPGETLREVNKILAGETERFNAAYAKVIEDLKKHNICVINEKQVPRELKGYLRDYFDSEVRPHLMPIMIKAGFRLTRLRDDPMYLAVHLAKSSGKGRPAHALIAIPTPTLNRFKVLPKTGDTQLVMYLDDIIRFGMPGVFSPLPYDRFESYAVKFTRDAEMHFDDDFTESFFEKISEGLRARDEGNPVRLNYDVNIPKDFLRILLRKLNFTSDDTLFPGARYHNRRDLMKFPKLGDASLHRESSTPVSVPGLKNVHRKGFFRILRDQDLLLHFPYHSFNCFLDLLREASIDPLVRTIKITQYRFATNSAVAKALAAAVRAGKRVTILVEPRARFDEEANITWADEYQKAGIRVILGVPGLKVHSKLCYITRQESGKKRRYCCVGTGNFHDDTAKLYTDHLLLTSHPEIGRDVSRVFKFFESSYRPPQLKHLICSPFDMRSGVTAMIENEIENVKNGLPSGISIKLNNFSDPEMVELIYKASKAGVPVKLIVRSMFSVVTEVAGVSDNIEAISIVDKFLEHTRIFVFANGGKPRYFITSGDLLPRNLDSRIEITCPIYDENLQQQLADYLDLQWQDGIKGRRLDHNLTNQYFIPKGKPRRAQIAIQDYLRSKARAKE